MRLKFVKPFFYLLMSLLNLIAGGSFWVINKQLARAVGIEAALLFSDLCQAQKYWNEKNGAEGYFYKVETDIQEDTTLSPHKQSKARSELKKAGLLKLKRKGLPAKIHYLIDKDCLNKFLKIFGTSEQKTSELDSQNFNTTKEYNTKEYNTKEYNTNIKYLEETKTILNLFQELTGVGYRLPSASKVEAYGGYKLCKARLQENDIEAILAVVRFKCGQWLQQPKMRQYCTYQTILRKNNFDKYLAEFSISQNNNFTSHEQTNSNKPSSLLNGLAELQARLSQKNNTGA
jgi:uncharacterized phage protein (TIGR02220 family)